MRKKSASVVVLASLGLALVFGSACGTDATGVEACREIENARCDRAVECQIPLTTPPPATDPTESCRRFYLDACLHGLQSAKDPNPAEKNGCVDAVKTGTCETVRFPEKAPACAFLIPPDAPPPDAASDVAADRSEPPPPAPQPDGSTK